MILTGLPGGRDAVLVQWGSSSVSGLALALPIWSVFRCLSCSNLGLSIKLVQSRSRLFLTWFFQHVLLLFKMFCKFVALALLSELKDHPILPATHTLAIVLFYLEAPQNGCFLYRLIYLLSILSPCHIEEVLGYHLITLWQDRILEKKIHTAAEIITLPKFTTLYKSLYS